MDSRLHNEIVKYVYGPNTGIKSNDNLELPYICKHDFRLVL